MNLKVSEYLEDRNTEIPKELLCGLGEEYEACHELSHTKKFLKAILRPRQIYEKSFLRI